MNEFAERLRLLLKEIDISAAKLSRALGRTPTYVANILYDNNRSPNRAFYEYLEATYNVNPDWLKSGEGDMFLPGGKQYRLSAGIMVKRINSLPAEKREALMLILDDMVFASSHAEDKDSPKID